MERLRKAYNDGEWLAIDELAHHAGCGDRQVRRIIDRLVQVGRVHCQGTRPRVYQLRPKVGGCS